jgi:tRNA A-37 threonylcarbamoyl transferase component Bud32
MEYIAGFTMENLVTEAPEPDWAPICDQAIEVIREIANNDFINFDIKTRNIIVRRDDEGLYRVFYLDFGECRFRDPSDSDEM